MKEIFCTEPIIACYMGRREYDDIDGSNMFFDCYSEFAFHMTEGFRLVLETESFYISADIHGVTKDKKTVPIEDYEQPGEWLDPFIHDDDENEPPWIDYEYTLFVGERLIDVMDGEGCFIMCFDDFRLKLVPHELDEADFPSFDRGDIWSYFHVLGAERHIVRKCTCGGSGELLLDFVSDYVVRCKNCKRSTWAQMCACEAIDEWNNGELHCDLSDITIK